MPTSPPCGMKVINLEKETRQESRGGSQVDWSCLDVSN